MDLIQQFIDTYKMKWTFYDAAGRLAAEKLQLALQNAGIRAIVTSRAKNPARLRTKVQRRNSRREEPYQTIEEIYDDIADLSGVRVSLYFPGVVPTASVSAPVSASDGTSTVSSLLTVIV